LIERSFDVVIVNTPLKDELGVLFSIDVSYRLKLGVLVLAKENIYADVYEKTNEFGILTISKPTSKETFLQALRLITSTLEKINMSKSSEPKK
jgi:response regulator NasT